MGNNNVEARVYVDGRFVYVEVKAIGYSNYDPSGQSGSHSINSMIQQVREALDSKLGNGAQIRLIASSAPTVLCLALGFNADHISGPWEINEFLSTDTSNVSYLFMAESVFCKIGMRPFPNNDSTMPLTAGEIRFFEPVFRTNDYDSYRDDKLQFEREDE